MRASGVGMPQPEQSETILMVHVSVCVSIHYFKDFRFEQTRK